MAENKIEAVRGLILDCNRRAVQAFCDNLAERHKYESKHPTKCAITKCSDGRIDLTRITGIPFGLILPFRSIGGEYDIGWPLMAKSVDEWAAHAHTTYNLAMILATYHFSASEKHLGCAGFNCDTEAAIASVYRFKEGIDRVYRGEIFPIVVGVETDWDTLIVHGDHGELLNMKTLIDQGKKIDEGSILKRLREILDKPDRLLKDLVPLLIGNVKHIQSLLKDPKKPEEYGHQERTLALGQGFDWLKFAQGNRTIIVGHCNPELHKPVLKAANIIKKNREEGRITDEHGILLVSMTYRSGLDGKGIRRRQAAEMSKYMAKVALDCIKNELPEMADYFVPLVGVTDLDNREFFEVI